MKEKCVALSSRLESHLNRRQVTFEEIPVSAAGSLENAVIQAGIAPEEVIRASLLIDPAGIVMVVHGLATTLDQAAVRGLTGRRLQPLTGRQADRLFTDCRSGFHPPVGGAYKVPVVVDSQVLALPRAVMASGDDRTLIAMDNKSLRLALADALAGELVLCEADQSPPADSRTISLDDVAEKLQSLYRLPPMPALALRVLRLTANAEASARELADLIEFDPSLAAQVMRYARSALFNYPGQIDSVQEAVTRVLGFDRVAHIAMGIASVRAFDVPRGGMLGLDEFWRHSLYCAFLSQKIAMRTKADPSLAYLCGLLHNFGLLLIGHLFPAEFKQLNSLREANPEHSMQALERQVFGGDDSQELLLLGHGAIGGILHKLWDLPAAVVKAAGVHQQREYRGDHQSHVMMVQLANELLKERGIGDELNQPDPLKPAAQLGLVENDLDILREMTETVSADLDTLAQSLTDA
jgi:HD-like signal output (HDOD) protein/prolyl-tRNA editing enzyme YbaK/EbsC (Cys-tRNA(Pro) deacylase)